MKSLRTPEELYENADELLFAAEHEMNRAKDDMVTHLICNHSRMSITHYLIGFLLERNIPIMQPGSIASLQQQCQSVDPRFNSLDLDEMACRYETQGQRYCLDFDKVNYCFKAAEQVRALVRAKVSA
jgi:hypothetical protein